MERHLIDGFRDLKEIYSGKSKIYRGVSNENDSHVVLKVLDQQYPSPETVARFKWEFALVSDKGIEGIAAPTDFIKIGNSFAIVMNDSGGDSLRQHLQKRSFSFHDILRIAIKITSSLYSIHDHKIMHKDINPANIVWNPETDAVQIIDFGISSKLSHEETSLFDSGKLEGTLAYISPEQTGRMNHAVDYRTDFYSLGVTLYELFTGKPPFAARDKMDMVHHHIAILPESLHSIDAEIPPVISGIVLKLMEKDPEKRYQTAFGLLSDLTSCLEQLIQNGKIEDFPIGEKDVSDRFNIPQKLYGRDKEIAALQAAFNRSLEGENSFTFVSGYSGVGKTVIVNEIQKSVAGQKGYFFKGKYDQFQKDIPFKAISTAFSHLMKQLLGESDEKLLMWKRELLDVLGANAGIIIDIIPDLERIIGPQPEVTKLNPTESLNRFVVSFENFVRVFTDSNIPLVIFLDDLQWVDPSSLHLMKKLVLSSRIKGLTIIGAYRSNEVGPGHPLQLTIEELESGASVLHIRVSPLNTEVINNIVADTLHKSPDQTLMLSEIITEKTKGNPFFSKAFMADLYKEKIIFFDRTSGEWRWSMERIEDMEVSENVVDLLVSKLRELPLACQDALKIAACIGDKFELKTLSIAQKEPPGIIAANLWAAISEELILPLDEKYRMLSRTGGMDNALDFGVSYRFQHDRVQQAAYSLIAEDQRAYVHLSIGRLLKEYTPDVEHRKDKLTDIVYHLNEGRRLISNGKEKIELARLNLAAGENAKSSSAYKAGYGYFSVGVELLPNNAWETFYDLTFDLNIELAQCAYLTGEYDRAEELISMALRLAGSDLERADILSMQARQYTTMGKLEASVRAGLEGLRLLGVDLPFNPDMPQLMSEMQTIESNLGGRPVADLANAPDITDPEQRAIAKLIMEMAASVYLLGNENLFALLFLKIVNHAIRHGNSVETAFGYLGYSIMLTASLGDLKTGYEFGKLGMALQEKYDDKDMLCRMMHTYSNFIFHWNTHWSNLTPLHLKGIDAGYHSGDLFYFGYIAHHHLIWDPTLTLDAIFNNKKEFRVLFKDYGCYDALDETNIVLQMFQNFRGLTKDRFSLDNEDFDELFCLKNMMERIYPTGITIYHISKAEVCFLYGDYARALEHIYEADKTVKSIMGLPYMVRACIITVLSLSRLLDSMNPEEAETAWERLNRDYEQMKKWADNFQNNFLHLQLLMEAEIARLNKDHSLAASLYVKAAKTAGKYGFIRDEAVVNEMAAKFYMDTGYETSASGYAREAHYLFGRWGAKRKVEHIEECFPVFFERHLPAGRTGMDTTISTVSGTATHSELDITSIFKASQAISRELRTDDLIRVIMMVSLENAGAQKGVFITVEDEKLTMKAVARSDNAGVEILLEQPFENYGNLPKSLINYVVRTKEKIVLNCAFQNGDFTKDPYFAKSKVRSVLCLPLISKGKIGAILYLENNLTNGVFTPDRLETLVLLSSKMIISLENAQLYEDLEEYNRTLEEQVAERTQQLSFFNKQLVEKNEELVEAHKEMELLASTDPLTGLLNRRSMMKSIQEEKNRFERKHTDFTLVISDIDKFKNFNDLYGHDCGDFVLVKIARLFHSTLRKQDIVSRWGGEEFLFLLPDTGLSGGVSLAEKLRKAIEESSFTFNGVSLEITMTFGVCQFNPPGSVDDCIQKADQALYKGKTSGRNRVVAAKSEEKANLE